MGESVILSLPLAVVLYGAALFFCLFDRVYRATRGVFNLISYDPDTGDGVVVFTTGASGVKDDRNIYSVCGEVSLYIYEAIAQEEDFAYETADIRPAP